MIVVKIIQKIVLGLYFLLICSMQWIAISPLIAEEGSSEVWLLHPGALYKCMDNEKTLAIDYSMHPYYLRVDLDGDGEMEYVISVLDSSGWERRGLMVCHEDGVKTIYRGIADRAISAEDKDRIDKTRGIVKDAVLIEGQTSEATLNSTVSKNHSIIVSHMFRYTVKKCCIGKGKGMGGQFNIYGD